MVSVSSYEVKQNEKGEIFCTLILQGGIELVKSKTTNQYYATVRRTTMLTTFDEQTCLSMVGEKIPGRIGKVECEEYDYTNNQTGEIIKMKHRWEYLPDESISSSSAFPNTANGTLAKVVH